MSSRAPLILAYFVCNVVYRFLKYGLMSLMSTIQQEFQPLKEMILST